MEDKKLIGFRSTAILKKIDCDVSSIPELCRIEGVEDSRAKQLRLIESVKQWNQRLVTAIGYADIMMIFWGVWKPGKSVTEAEEDMRI